MKDPFDNEPPEADETDTQIEPWHPWGLRPSLCIVLALVITGCVIFALFGEPMAAWIVDLTEGGRHD